MKNKKIILTIITLSLFFIAGLGIAQLNNTFGSKTQNMTLNIICQENQRLFNCDCNPNVFMEYDITSNRTEGKELYINYSGRLNVNGKCIQGKKSTELSYTGEPHDEILTDLDNWLRTEYNLRNKKELPKESLGGGKINVK